MDDEALAAAPDDSRGGRGRAAAAVETAEERQELAGHRVDQGELAVVERPLLAGQVDADILGFRRKLRWNPLADDEPPAAESLAAQLHEDVPLVRTNDGIGRQERDDETVLPDRGHWPVSETEERVR